MISLHMLPDAKPLLEDLRVFARISHDQQCKSSNLERLLTYVTLALEYCIH